MTRGDRAARGAGVRDVRAWSVTWRGARTVLAGLVLMPGFAACGPAPDAADGAAGAARAHGPAGAGAADAKPTVRVAAASSLRELLESVAAAFAAASDGAALQCSFDASSTLARQIGEGAPFDVFLSADEASVERVADRLDLRTRRVFLSNQLALAGRAGWTPAPSEPAQLAHAPAFAQARLALPGPAVPAGRYWREWFAAHGLQEALESRCVQADSVRAALALVEAGTVDAAFVYSTDVAAAAPGGRVSRLWVAPAGEGPAIAYVAAVVQGSGAAARDLVHWLAGEEFLKLALDAGFTPPR